MPPKVRKRIILFGGLFLIFHLLYATLANSICKTSNSFTLAEENKDKYCGWGYYLSLRLYGIG